MHSWPTPRTGRFLWRRGAALAGKSGRLSLSVRRPKQGQLLLAENHQLGIEAQKALFAPLPLWLIEGEQCLPQQDRTAQPAADAVEGLPQPLPVTIGGDPVLFGHPLEGQWQSVRQMLVIGQ